MDRKNGSIVSKIILRSYLGIFRVQRPSTFFFVLHPSSTDQRSELQFDILSLLVFDIQSNWITERVSLSILVGFVYLYIFIEDLTPLIIAFDDRYVNIGPFREACFPMAMLDPAAFHQVLSNAILNRVSRRPENNNSESYEAVKHHALAVKLVNQRITDVASSTTEGFVGAVMGFACYHVRFLLPFKLKYF